MSQEGGRGTVMGKGGSSRLRLLFSSPPTASRAENLSAGIPRSPKGALWETGARGGSTTYSSGKSQCTEAVNSRL